MFYLCLGRASLCGTQVGTRAALEEKGSISREWQRATAEEKAEYQRQANSMQAAREEVLSQSLSKAELDEHAGLRIVADHAIASTPARPEYSRTCPTPSLGLWPQSCWTQQPSQGRTCVVGSLRGRFAAETQAYFWVRSCRDAKPAADADFPPQLPVLLCWPMQMQ